MFPCDAPFARVLPWQDVPDAGDGVFDKALCCVTPPRIHFDYTLFQHGKPVRRGEARLSDMNYLSDPRARGDGDRLVHEKLLLDDWFRKSFK